MNLYLTSISLNSVYSVTKSAHRTESIEFELQGNSYVMTIDERSITKKLPKNVLLINVNKKNTNLTFNL